MPLARTVVFYEENNPIVTGGNRSQWLTLDILGKLQYGLEYGFIRAALFPSPLPIIPYLHIEDLDNAQHPYALGDSNFTP